MEIVNTTPYTLHPFDCSPLPARPAMSFVVKATFKLRPDAVATPVDADQQQPIRGDETFLDDLGRSLAYATDLVAWKPRGEVTLNAVCHAPGGRPRTECDVRLAMGGIDKTLKVSGDRRWSSGAAPRMSAPLAFTSMPIRWERAFGGLLSQENPLGRGVDVEPGDEAVYLPNVESSDARVSSPKDRPRPAGFGAVAPAWAPRFGRLGTRDHRWATFRAPLPPLDADPRSHNAAPDDQQLADGVYFRGDETIVLENMHPERPRYECALPRKRLRAIVWMQKKSADGSDQLAEIDLVLDTAFVDAVNEELVLVWRKPLATQGQGAIAALYLAEEDMKDAPVPIEAHVAKFRALRAPSGPTEAEMDAEIDEQRKELDRMLRAQDPKLADEVRAAKDQDEVVRILMRATEQKTRELERRTEALRASA